eukprot:4626737-Amphidinium_carterae.1
MHQNRSGEMMEMKITVFTEYTEEELYQRWPAVFSRDRKQNRMLDFHRDMVLFKRACFWVKQ